MFSEKNVSFIYSIVTLFSKTAYYLKRLIGALHHCSKKTSIFKFRLKVCKIKVEQRKLMLLQLLLLNTPENAWICLNKKCSEYSRVLNLSDTVHLALSHYIRYLAILLSQSVFRIFSGSYDRTLWKNNYTLVITNFVKPSSLRCLTGF